MNDYTDAAERHFLSGCHDLQGGHQATASHCFGIAAECVLKALMCDLQPQNKPVSGNHLGLKLWAEFANHQTVQSHPSRVAHVQQYQPGFVGWAVHQRYLNRTDPNFAQVRLTQQESSARGLVGLMQLIQRGLA